ncbi:MAG: sigma-70 family RNA polymerase sigma factor [Thermosynechococcaceae cyanobacterium]
MNVSYNEIEIRAQMSWQQKQKVAIGGRLDRDNSLEDLVLSHLWIAEYHAKRIQRSSVYPVELADLIQAGYEGLCHLAKQYISNQGCNFSSYVWHRVKDPMKRLVRQEWRCQKAAITVQHLEVYPIESELFDINCYGQLRRELQTLPRVQRQILECTFLEEPSQSVKTLSRTLGLAPGTIRRNKRAAMRQLRRIVA